MECPEFLFLDSLWHMAAKWLYSVGISSLSRPWFGTNGEKKFPMEAHKIYANKIACGFISEGIYKALQVEVVQKKTYQWQA